MFCTSCGARNPEHARFCRACGNTLAPAPGSEHPDIDPLHVAATEVTLPPGTVLAGRYRIKRELGQGGMGRVYLADDQALDTPIAIKVLHEILSRDAGSVKRLKDEARLSMQLAHPHIVRVNHFEDGGPLKFLVMEYVEGETLAERLAREGRLGEDEVRRIGIALCDALAHAHAKKVLHRDVKPGNVLLGTDGSIKLADFGIAQAAHDSMSRLTNQRAPTSGTLPYMAPEQVMDDETTERSDLYALGVTLYELLTGKPPFWRGDVTKQILEKPPPSFEGVTSELSAVVMKLLAKLPEHRPHSARALMERLGSLAPESSNAYEDEPDRTFEEIVADGDDGARSVLECTVSNPHYESDLEVLEGSGWDLSRIMRQETILIVTGCYTFAELLDRPVAEHVRDAIDAYGKGIPCRRAIVLGDLWYLHDKSLHANPVISVGGPSANQLTGRIISTGDGQGPNGVYYTVGKEGRQVALWGQTASDCRRSAEWFLSNRAGLDWFLKRCWGT